MNDLVDLLGNIIIISVIVCLFGGIVGSIQYNRGYRDGLNKGCEIGTK